MNRTVQSRLERIVEATAAKLAEKKTIRREYNTELEQVITLLLSFICLLSLSNFVLAMTGVSETERGRAEVHQGQEEEDRPEHQPGGDAGPPAEDDTQRRPSV